MRPRRRRRPDGSAQGPQETFGDRDSATVAVLRLGYGRALLDLPPSSPAAIRTIWVDDDQAVWRHATWPLDRSTGLLIAPVDLSAGHLLEVEVWSHSGRSVAYAVVVGETTTAVTVLSMQSLEDAFAMSIEVHRRWIAAQLQHADRNFSR
jgi:hypothetical protein